MYDEFIYVKLSGLVESLTAIVKGCLKPIKVAIFVVLDFKGVLVKYKKYGTLSVYNPFMKKLTFKPIIL